jgi:hypothetical protein
MDRSPDDSFHLTESNYYLSKTVQRKLKTQNVRLNSDLNIVNTTTFSRTPYSAKSAKSNHASIKDYEIEKEIGRGAYGKVYLAKRRKTQMRVAIKVLDKDFINRVLYYCLTLF